MRWLMPLSFACVAVACYSGVPALAEATEPGSEKPAIAAGEKPDRPPGRPPTPEMKAKLLAEFDADGDGKLSDAERATMKEAMAKRRADKPKPEKGRKRPTKEGIIAQFDENGDGKLTGTEAEKARAAHKARNEGKKGPPRGDQENAGANEGQTRGRGQGGNGPGGLNNEMRARMVREFDANGDGQLQGAELERARGAAARVQAQQRQGARFGGPGGGNARSGAPGGGGGGAGGGAPRR